MNFWGRHELEPGQEKGFSFGPLSMWLRRTANEWLVGHTYGPYLRSTSAGEPYEAGLMDGEAPDDLKWQRWASPAENCVMKLSPMMPDRPVIAYPVTPIKLLPGVSIDLFVRIPVFIDFSLGAEGQEASLFTIPVFVLSNTWFGDPVNGELCYSLSTRALSEPYNVQADMSRAMCRVRVSNGSKIENLEFDKLCIRAPFLTVYRAEEQLWTNEMSVVFSGLADISDVRYGKRPPGPPLVDNDYEMVGEPREKTENVLKRSFAGIQSWLEC